MEAFLEGDTLEVNIYKVDENEEDLRQEMMVAQKTYNSLFPKDTKPKLLKPTILKDLCAPSQAINYITAPSQPESDAENQPLNDHATKISRTSSGTSPATTSSTTGKKPPTSSITSLNLSEEAQDIMEEEEEVLNHPCKTVCKGGVEKFLAEKCPRFEQLKRQKHATYIISGTIKRHGRPVPIVQGVKDVPCDCYELYQEKVQKFEYEQVTEKNIRKLNKNNLVYGIGGTAVTPSGPAYIISSVQPQIDIAYLRKCIDNIKQIVDYQKEEKQTRDAALKSYFRLRHMVKHVGQCKRDLTRVLIKSCSVGPDYQAEKECDCMQKYIDTLSKYEEYMKLKQARNKLALLKEKYIISGVVAGPDGPIYVLAGVKKMPTLNSQKHCMAFVKKYKQLESKIEPITLAEKKESIKSICKIKEEMCRCKEEFENLIKNRCQCDKCYEEERQKTATYVVSGAKATPSGHVIPVMTGVFDKGCTCLDEYKQKMAQFESYRLRINARIKMQEQKDKYVISGVANTPDGPVYNITGLRPIIHCLCEEAQRALEAEEHQLAIMPKLPHEGHKYAIKGVKETQEGNVFVISEALKDKQCSCMTMLKDFEREHYCCMEAYNEYKAQLEQDAKEYFKDLEVVEEGDVLLENFKDYQQFDRYGAKPTIMEELEMLGDLHEEDSSKTDKDEKAIAEDIAQCSCNEANTMNNDFLEELDKELSSVKDEMQTENEVEEKTDEIVVKKEEGEEKIDDEEVKFEEEENKEAEEEVVEELVEQPDQPQKSKKNEYKMFEFNRFIITEKLPKNYERQQNILQKMLKSMAKDGFPLAKLPDCHKLPHFRLWFQLRTGIYWTQEARMGFFYKMMELWNFTDRMKIQFKTPSLPFTKKQIDSATYKDAELYKKIAMIERDKFFRGVKQSTIDTGRAFFPSLFTYEFPNKTFRETFFTYVPAKELQVLPYRLVQLHEMTPLPKAMRLTCSIP